MIKVENDGIEKEKGAEAEAIGQIITLEEEIDISGDHDQDSNLRSTEKANENS